MNMRKLLIKISKHLSANIMLITAVVAISVGVFLSLNLNSNLPRTLTPGASLVAIEDMEKDLDSKNISLKDQIESVDSELTDLKKQLTDRQEGLKQMVKEADDAKKSAQISAVSGPGVVITLSDSEEALSSPNSIAHASDMRDLVNHFWNNNAKSISIVGSGDIEERVMGSTSIDCIVNTVLINETKIVPPFKIKAIGDIDELTRAYEDRNTLSQIYDRVEKEGLIFTLEKSDNINIAKYNGAIEVENGKIK